MGVIDRNRLEAELQLHIIDVVRDLLTWQSGNFQFTLGKFSDEGVLMGSGLSAEFLLLEGARLDDEAVNGDGADDTILEDPPADGAVGYLDESTPMSHPVAVAPDPESLAGLVNDADLGTAVIVDQGRASRKDLELLPAMIEELSSAGSGQDVFLMILRFAGELMNRSVMFLVRGDTVTGWGQFGVEVAEGSADEVVRSIVVPLSEASSFRDVGDTRVSLKGNWPELPGNQLVVERLGGVWPRESFLTPIVSADRVVAFLYGDNLPKHEPVGPTEGIEAFIRVAAAALSKTLLQQQMNRARTGGS
jgi:hypothetical protein